MDLSSYLIDQLIDQIGPSALPNRTLCIAKWIRWAIWLIDQIGRCALPNGSVKLFDQLIKSDLASCQIDPSSYAPTAYVNIISVYYYCTFAVYSIRINQQYFKWLQKSGLYAKHMPTAYTNSICQQCASTAYVDSIYWHLLLVYISLVH